MPSIMGGERLMAEPRLKGEIPVPAEGSILPDSYAFTTGESRAAVVKRMQAAMDKAFAELWAKRTPRTAVKNRNEAITLASIVEKRSEEHTSELQSLMRISYAVFCLQKKKINKPTKHTTTH